MTTNSVLDPILPAPAPVGLVHCDRLDCRRNDDSICTMHDYLDGPAAECTDYRRDDDKCDCGAQKEYHWPGEYGCRVHG